MSLMDDVFDLREAVEQTDAEALLERVEARLWEYEARCDRLQSEVNTIDDFLRLAVMTQQNKADDPGELIWSEVTGLHNKDDLRRIAELEKLVDEHCRPDD